MRVQQTRAPPTPDPDEFARERATQTPSTPNARESKRMTNTSSKPQERALLFIPANAENPCLTDTTYGGDMGRMTAVILKSGETLESITLCTGCRGFFFGAIWGLERGGQVAVTSVSLIPDGDSGGSAA